MPFWAPLALLGFHPAHDRRRAAISLLYQYWIHTESIGEARRRSSGCSTRPRTTACTTASNQQYLDKNHGGILIIWDRLFGTFEPEVERPVYGLTKNIDTFNPLPHRHPRVRRHRQGHAAPRALRTRLARAFRNPAWKPPEGKAAPPSTLPA